jgi:hypothetical protein
VTPGNGENKKHPPYGDKLPVMSSLLPVPGDDFSSPSPFRKPARRRMDEFPSKGAKMPEAAAAG